MKSNPKKIDRLAAVVIFILVSEGKQGMSSEAIACECERDAEKNADRREVDLALRALIDYELAVWRRGRTVQADSRRDRGRPAELLMAHGTTGATGAG